MSHPTIGQVPIDQELANILAAQIIPQVLETEAGCWIRGNRSSNGYTNLYRLVDGRRKYYYAHRVMYVYAHGPIPEGYAVDHLCDNPPCCNPEHLRAVPHHANVLRGENNPYAVNSRKTHCIRGHELPPYERGKTRVCMPCRVEKQRQYRARKRAASA